MPTSHCSCKPGSSLAPLRLLLLNLMDLGAARFTGGSLLLSNRALRRSPRSLTSWVRKFKSTARAQEQRHHATFGSADLCSTVGPWEGHGSQTPWQLVGKRGFEISTYARAARRTKAPKSVSTAFKEDDQVWWEKQMERCDKPQSVKMVEKLDWSNMLGLNEDIKLGKITAGSLNAEILEERKKHPRIPIVCRVGEFYEAVGFDAVLLVEHAGLNPMGNFIPKAGCPIRNLKRVIQDLGAAGLNVKVMEEVSTQAVQKGRKQRYVRGIFGQGHAFAGDMLNNDTEEDVMEPLPLVGVAKSVRGYSMVSVSVDTRSYTVDEGLTEEGVFAKLRQDSCASPVYLHSSVLEATPGRRPYPLTWESMLSNREVETYVSSTPAHEEALLNRIRQDFALPADEPFETVAVPSGSRPRPLYHSTSTQLGIYPTAGVPSLVDAILPPDVQPLCRNYMQHLLLNPPPYSVASQIQAACRLLASLDVGLPDFRCEPDYKLVKLIREREASAQQFRQLRQLAHGVRFMLSEPSPLRPLSHLLLHPTALKTGHPDYPPQALASDCRAITAAIDKVVDVRGGMGGQSGGAISESPEFPEVDLLFKDMELAWQGRVVPAVLAEELMQVSAAAKELGEAVSMDFGPILQRSRDKQLPSGIKAELVYSTAARQLCLRGKGLGNMVISGKGEETVARLEKFTSEVGNALQTNCWITPRVREAVQSYKAAADSAYFAVQSALKDLAVQLNGHLLGVRTVAWFTIICRALDSHVHEALRRKWSFPTLLDPPKAALEGGGGATQNGAPNGGVLGGTFERRLAVEGLAPFWLPMGRPTVLNSFDMSAMFLLTGPNTSGKSTMLRGVCATALLANCGLLVPAQHATVARFDAFFLRMTVSDSPAEGRSSFEMEMLDVRNIRHDATAKSLVLVDELGRGTEVHDGTGFAGMVIEQLDACGCMGIFATHLHRLLDLPLRAPRLRKMAMETRLAESCAPPGGPKLGWPKREPTWKMVEGECRESLAAETALKAGVAPEDVQRARELKALLLSYEATGRFQTVGEAQELGLSEVSESSESEEEEEELAAVRSSSVEPWKDVYPKLQEVVRSVRQGRGRAGNVVRRKAAASKEVTSTSRREQELEEEMEVGRVGAGFSPGPRTANRAHVYVRCVPEGYYYVGETDDLRGRIRNYRKRKVYQNASFLYVALDSKSESREVETALIKALLDAGIPLSNRLDQKHRHFGTGTEPENWDLYDIPEGTLLPDF